MKNRFMLLNETGFAIQYKQIGTPDPHEQVSGQNERDKAARVQMRAGKERWWRCCDD